MPSRMSAISMSTSPGSTQSFPHRCAVWDPHAFCFCPRSFPAATDFALFPDPANNVGCRAPCSFLTSDRAERSALSASEYRARDKGFTSPHRFRRTCVFVESTRYSASRIRRSILTSLVLEQLQALHAATSLPILLATIPPALQDKHDREENRP